MPTYPDSVLSAGDVAGALRAVGQLYDDAAAGSRTWMEALRVFHTLFEFEGLIFEQHEIGDSRLVEVESDGLPDAGLQQWAEHYHALCPRLRYLQHQPAGTVGYDNLVISPAEIRRDPVYQEFLHPYGLGFFLSTTIEHDRRHYITLSMQRPLTMGHASDRDIALLEFLTPHLRQVFLLRRRLGRVLSELRDYREVFETLRVGVILVGVNADVQYTNESARRTLGTCRGLAIKRGTLRFRDTRDQRRFARVLETAASLTLTEPSSDRLWLRAADGSAVVGVDLVPLSSKPGFLEALPHQARARGHLLLLLSEPDGVTAAAESILATAYGLTAREAELAAALARGVDLATHANERGVALATVRSQLASLRARMGARTQADVVRLVLRWTSPLVDPDRQ